MEKLSLRKSRLKSNVENKVEMLKIKSTCCEKKKLTVTPVAVGELTSPYIPLVNIWADLTFSHLFDFFSISLFLIQSRKCIPTFSTLFTEFWLYSHHLNLPKVIFFNRNLPQQQAHNCFFLFSSKCAELVINISQTIISGNSFHLLWLAAVTQEEESNPYIHVY